MIADAGTLALGAEQFLFMRQLLLREAAIVIDAGKEYLVDTRLAPIARRRGYPSVNALIDQLRFGAGAAELRLEAVDALTTNETLFFRDASPFEALRDHVIPEFCAKQPGATLKVWSAACSTGQEPYSVAMLVAEHFPGLAVRITATDLSPTVLARARAGIYQQAEVNRGLSARYMIKYFKQTEQGMEIAPALRACIDFRELNLARPWPLLPQAHVVLLRNVMIYFDLEVRRQILRQVRDVLAPGGYLALGGAEGMITLDQGFISRPFGRTTFYQV